MSPVAYLGFGSNLGNRVAKFFDTVQAVGQLPTTVVTHCSGLYETEPIGLSDDGPKFINAVIRVETELSPLDLIEHIRRIELKLGKSPEHESHLSRVVDLDLLLYDDLQVDEKGLKIPHPRMHDRAFVLAPLAEIAPEAVHPVLCRSMAELVNELHESQLAGVRRLYRISDGLDATTQCPFSRQG